MEAAAGCGEREGPLDLVAGAHAAAARDAELVLEDEIGMARVVPCLVRRAGPAELADAELARDGRELRVLGGWLGQLGEHKLDDVPCNPTCALLCRLDDHPVAAERRARR